MAGAGDVRHPRVPVGSVTGFALHVEHDWAIGLKEAVSNAGGGAVSKDAATGAGSGPW